MPPRMFSGIIETTSIIESAEVRGDSLCIAVARPTIFADVSLGDSIAVNGVCLTIEAMDERQIRFSLGPETLKITGWTLSALEGRAVNMERSLRLGDRIHGHLVAGHVDDVGRIASVEDGELTRTLWIRFTDRMRPFIWVKGSVALQGVSLTINELNDDMFSVCLIPETLKRSVLGRLQTGDSVNLEADAMARAWYHWKITGAKS